MSEITAAVRKLRKNPTKAEVIFWEKVRNKKINGKKILRQKPFVVDYENTKRFFVADFYCAEKKLIIEIDGKIHDKQKENDQYRDFLLQKKGLKILRFKNEEVLHDIDFVIAKIKTFL